jgi:hypothetical protein
MRKKHVLKEKFGGLLREHYSATDWKTRGNRGEIGEQEPIV